MALRLAKVHRLPKKSAPKHGRSSSARSNSSFKSTKPGTSWASAGAEEYFTNSAMYSAQDVNAYVGVCNRWAALSHQKACDVSNQKEAKKRASDAKHAHAETIKNS